MEEARYSTNAKMYLRKLDVLHTIRSEDPNPSQHLESVIQFFAACESHGFTAEPSNGKPGLEEGEESWPINGYIVGPTKQKDGSTAYVVWLYGRGRYKTASVYVEKWNRLWFVPDTSKVWPTNQAPEAESARTSGFFVEVPEKEIVLTSYTNREGEKRRAFDRVLGESPVKPPAAVPPVTSAASGAAAQLADTIINGVQTGATDPGLLVKFAERAMLRRPEVGMEWPRVQNVFRSKLTPMRYQFPRDTMLDALEKLRPMLGETHYKDLLSSFEEPDDVPF